MYKITLPSRKYREQHVNGKCLFESTSFDPDAPGGMLVDVISTGTLGKI